MSMCSRNGTSPLRSYAAPVTRKSSRESVGIFLVCALAYTIFLGSRIADTPTSAPVGSHYTHLGQSLLAGQLHNVGNRALGIDDEAFYGGKWYVSFPLFPAILLLPLTAAFGLQTPAPLVWALFAALGPALLYRSLSDFAGSKRTAEELCWLVLLFAFGSPYFTAAVQGTVWFAGHLVTCVFLILYFSWARACRRPALAGAAIGCVLLTRPTAALAGVFFLHQLRTHRHNHRGLVRTAASFALPAALAAGVALVLNYLRFDHPLEFGHRHLQIRWQARLETWGLFSFHYFERNLIAAFGLLPRLTQRYPFVIISTVGLAVWFTSPALLATSWSRPAGRERTGLVLAALAVSVPVLLYQSTGYEQFGYRYLLDVIIMLMLLIAVGARPLSLPFRALTIWSVLVNAFGAITFQRAFEFYDRQPWLDLPPT